MISNTFLRSLSVRQAVQEDKYFIINMIRQLMQVVFDSKNPPEIIGIEKNYDSMIKNKELYHIFVAEDKDQKTNQPVKLGAAITTTQINLTAGPYLYIQDLVVDHNSRGKGVGSALINHIIQYSKEHDFGAIELIQPPESNKFNEQRTKFYSKFGFEILGRERLMFLKHNIKIID